MGSIPARQTNLKGIGMKKLITFILLFFCVNVNAIDVYVTEDPNGVIITLVEAQCPYSPNTKLSLAIAEIDNQKHVGCWVSDLGVVIIIWNVNDLVFEEYYKVSDFVLEKII